LGSRNRQQYGGLQVRPGREPEWRQRMRPKVANAEVEIFMELSRRKLTTGYTTSRAFPFTQIEIEKHHCFGANVDGMWKQLDIIVFYDGHPHTRTHQMNRDDAVDAVLVERGWDVHRYPYKAPISDARLKEIVDDIQVVLERKGYKASGGETFGT